VNEGRRPFLLAVAVLAACGGAGDPAGAPSPAAPAVADGSARPLPWTVLGIDPPAADVAVGGTLRLVAVVGDAPVGGATWRVEGGAAGAVDASGAYTAPDRPGEYRVTATLGAQAATAVLTVKAGGAIALSPSPLRALPFGTAALAATVTGLPDPGVRWSLAEGPAAGTIDDAGRLTARGPGTFHAVATSVADPSVSATVEVRVSGTLEDFGGRVLPTPAVHALWWGTRDDFGDAVDAIGAFLSAVDGSPWLAVLDQYLRGARARVTFAGHLFVPGAPSVPHPSPDEVVATVCAALDANGIAPDPEAVYLLFTPAPPVPGGLAGWHWYGECHGVPIAPSWISRDRRTAACSAASSEAHAAVIVAAHELAETMTDPEFHYTWANWAHLEVADYCGRTCVDLGGRGFALPLLWSNAANGCVAG
jgi:hypothetical protein